MLHRKNSLPVVGLALLLTLQGCGPSVGDEATAKQKIIDPTSAGAKVLVKFCSDCHAPPQPAVHQAKEWPNVLYRMQERRRMKAYELMSDEELAVLTDYLERHAKEGEQ